MAVLLLESQFGLVAVDEEFRRPVQILEFPVIAVDRKTPFHRAANIGRPVIAHGSPREGVRGQRDLPRLWWAGRPEKNQPAMRDLDKPGQADPWSAGRPV